MSPTTAAAGRREYLRSEERRSQIVDVAHGIAQLRGGFQYAGQCVAKNHAAAITLMNIAVPANPKVPETHIDKKPQNTAAYDNDLKSFSKFTRK